MFGRHAKKAAEKSMEKKENAARKNALEDLFYDFNASRAQIYKMNFFRGIFFGLGSVLGGTIVVALLIWILSAVAGFFPPLEDFFNGVTDTIQSKPN
ncbi:MAG TPA: DUF5665 domain-containing protein [Candidatus Saccharimonadales bacterium]|jgi:hypothetical protein|nr:DUF5665 domain-containing protein [Candidatus Saccharimonadales bacterium]